MCPKFYVVNFFRLNKNKKEKYEIVYTNDILIFFHGAKNYILPNIFNFVTGCICNQICSGVTVNASE